MAIVTIHQAKTHFSQLIQRALAGEEIIVAKGKDPIVKIVPLPEGKKERTLGGAKGIVQHISRDFDAPLEEFPDALQ
jgi:prevent-host-death family protein